MFCFIYLSDFLFSWENSLFDDCANNDDHVNSIYNIPLTTLSSISVLLFPTFLDTKFIVDMVWTHLINPNELKVIAKMISKILPTKVKH